jgi:hypothetical protein
MRGLEGSEGSVGQVDSCLDSGDVERGR